MPPPPVHVLIGAALETGAGKAKGKEKEVTHGKGKVQVRNDDEDSDDDGGPGGGDIDPSYKDQHDLSALYIVQQASCFFVLPKIYNPDSRFQAWSQATKADTTIMVVQSGNYEFIGIRHRLSQTLYVSDIIQPHACEEPSYGKIHVGIYVAATMDAIDRAKQRAAGRQDGSDSGGPSGGPSDRRGDHKGDKKLRDGSNKKSGGSKKKKGGSNPQEGGSTGGGGTMMVMAVHEMVAKVCTI